PLVTSASSITPVDLRRHPCQRVPDFFRGDFPVRHRSSRPLGRSKRMRMALPAALIGTLAATLTATPAAGMTDASTDRDAHRLTWRDLPPVAAAVRPIAAAVVPVPQSTAAPATHTVQRGDSVFAIAQRHGLRTADLLTWNGLSWSSIIYPGQV